MKNTITITISIIIILLLAGGTFFALSRNQEEELETFTEQEQAPFGDTLDTFSQDDSPGMGNGEDPEWFDVSEGQGEAAVEESGPQEEEPAEAEEVVISMDESGFSPPTVTVPAGTTVRFVNNGQGMRWPASDPHPSHHILPEFDSGRGLATGESYSFTFTDPGSWGFHDHLNVAITGTVVVQ